MPRRKSGIGRQPGDDFGKFKKPQDINDIRQSNRFSFRVPKRKDDLTQLDDQCGFEETYTDTNLLSSRGRQTGELVLYDPIQQKNYLSQYQRYEAALDLEIHSIEKLANGKTAYRFCSKRSPEGYWEVQIGGATFVRLIKPILTIICPRPFKLGEVFSGIETDDDSLVWEQLQGRPTIVSPESGAGSLDPTFVILPTVRDPLEPPILIRVSLGSDPSIGDTLAIATTATSTQFGISSGTLSWGQDPCRNVRSLFFLPSGNTQAIIYTNQLLYISWVNPTCDAEEIVGFTWQKNTTGQYVDVQSFNTTEQRRFAFEPRTRYRIITKRIFGGVANEIGAEIDAPRFEFTSPENSSLILADERYKGLSSTAIESRHNTIPFTLIGCPTDNDTYFGIGFNLIESRHTTAPFTLIGCPTDNDVYISNLSSKTIEGRHTVTQQGVIGVG